MSVSKEKVKEMIQTLLVQVLNDEKLEEQEQDFLEYISDYLSDVDYSSLQEITEYVCPLLENFYDDVDFVEIELIKNHNKVTNFDNYLFLFPEHKEEDDSEEVDYSCLLLFLLFQEMEKNNLISIFPKNKAKSDEKEKEEEKEEEEEEKKEKEKEENDNKNENEEEDEGELIIKTEKEKEKEKEEEEKKKEKTTPLLQNQTKEETKLEKPVSILDLWEESEDPLEALELIDLDRKRYILKYALTEEENQKLQEKFVKKVDKKEVDNIKRQENKLLKTEEKNISVEPIKQHMTGKEGIDNFNIHVKEFTINFGGNILLRDGEFKIVYGRRYGLIGRNGVGKTTLLRYIARRELKFNPRISVTLIEQEAIGDERSPLEQVLHVDRERENLLKEQSEIESWLKINTKEFFIQNYKKTENEDEDEDGEKETNEIEKEKDQVKEIEKEIEIEKEPKENENEKETNEKENENEKEKETNEKENENETEIEIEKENKEEKTKEQIELDYQKIMKEKENRLNYIFKRLDEIEAHQAESFAKKILFGLGFTEKMQTTAAKNFSGGWRMRLSLAKAIFAQPHLLLLDEPDNFLDLQGIIWLEKYLATEWKNSLIIVSHSRSFINNIVTDILHFANEKLTYFKGNYDHFENLKKRQRKEHEKAYQKNKKQREHIQEFVDRFRFKATIASRVQSSIKRLDKLGEVEEIVTEKPITFSFKRTSETLPNNLIKFSNVYFKYDITPMLIKDANFLIEKGQKIVIVGENGIGKSTLLKLIWGINKPTKGAIELNGRMKMFMLSQHFVDHLNLENSPVEYLRSKYKGIQIKDIRSTLGSFGLRGEKVFQKIKTLSGGQKSRVIFSEINLAQPDVLLLDEPSSFLSIEAVDALIKALKRWNGTVVVVTHDERLITKVCNEIWVIEDRRLSKFEGNFIDYRNKQARNDLF
ncbi:atp-binding cassette sub-family f member [Anaeramoeba flamelloides]|uniref:Atp-binding cassette sub-family f member n=1 Tax=Anaeramoeba flamelloides TaxID=1746091 RepID=A0AAV7YA28_9EUKA|nr:atp-binding cassette sub-family f member [Anaeramoeba flamelloides]